jgi:hypothetical protein
MELATIIAIASALGTAGILVQNYFSSKKLDDIQGHFQAEKKSPDWELKGLRTDGEGRSHPYIIPEIENIGEGTANNVEIESRPVSTEGDRCVLTKNTEKIEKIYPENIASIKTKIDDNTDRIRVIISCDGEENWKKNIDLDSYEFEDWMEKKLGRI